MDDGRWYSAGALCCFFEIALPATRPRLLGALVLGLILACNNLEVSFYNFGAIPTLFLLGKAVARYPPLILVKRFPDHQNSSKRTFGNLQNSVQ